MPKGDGPMHERDRFDPSRHPSSLTPRSVSLAALRLHSHGLLASVELGHTGHVPDGYLDTLLAGQPGDDITVTVLELTMAGVWRRVQDGYQII